MTCEVSAGGLDSSGLNFKEGLRDWFQDFFYFFFPPFIAARRPSPEDGKKEKGEGRR